MIHNFFTWCLECFGTTEQAELYADNYIWGRYSLFKINFGGVIIVLANKSITTCSFTFLSISVMIPSLNDYWKLLLNRVGSLSRNLLHKPWNDWLHCSSKKSILSLVQVILATNIDRIKYYLGPLTEIFENNVPWIQDYPFIEQYGCQWDFQR